MTKIYPPSSVAFSPLEAEPKFAPLSCGTIPVSPETEARWIALSAGTLPVYSVLAAISAYSAGTIPVPRPSTAAISPLAGIVALQETS